MYISLFKGSFGARCCLRGWFLPKPELSNTVELGVGIWVFEDADHEKTIFGCIFHHLRVVGRVNVINGVVF